MHRLANDRKHEVMVEMRGGKGSVNKFDILNVDEMMGKGRLFSHMVLEPGCSIGNHDHMNEAEIYYIIKGTAKADDNGEVVTLHAGDMLYTGHESHHSIENAGDDTLEFIALILFQ